MAINQPPTDRFKWQLWQAEWEMKFNCARYYADYIMETGFYGALATHGRYGRFTEYHTKVSYWGFVDTKGSWPYPLDRPFYYPIPYYPKNQWQGERLGTIQIWSVSIIWSEENYLIVFVDLWDQVEWAIRVRDALLLPWVEPQIKA